MGSAASRRELSKGNTALKFTDHAIVLSHPLLEEYNRVTIEEITECRECFCEQHESSTFYLSEDEFEDIFSTIFDDCKVHYDLFQGRVFYNFAAAYILSKGGKTSLDMKVEMLFQLFDFDNNHRLNRVEMEMLFECVCESIHKVTATDHPHPGCEGLLVRRAFRDIQPKEIDVSKDEFIGWMAAQSDIRAYLLQFIDARFLTALQTALLNKLKLADAAFRQFADEENSVSFDNLLSILTDLQVPPVKDEEHRLVTMLGELGGFDYRKRISMNAFRAVIVPWVGVGVMDTDNSGSINLQELKVLLWVHQDKGTPEPHEDVVRQTMARLDLDFSGELDRMEWVEHNCEFNSETQRMMPSKGTQILFRKLDNESSSKKRISVNDIRRIITEEATKAVSFCLESMMDAGDTLTLKMIIKDLGVEISSDLDCDKSGWVWPRDLHNARDIINGKINKLVKYALQLCKMEVKEHHLKHEINLDFAQMSNLGVAQSRAMEATVRNKHRSMEKRATQGRG